MKRRKESLESLQNKPEKAPPTSLSSQSSKKRAKKKTSTRILLALLCIAAAAGVVFGLGMWTSRYPDSINMGTACDVSDMSHMDMSNMDNMCRASSSSTSTGIGTPIASLQAPQTAAHMAEFTLTAQYAHLPFFSKGHEDAWTFNGTSPGPTLRVRQGDLVVVHLVNHLSVGVTIHWHGVAVPNSADGVAGVTQDAVKPEQSYTYRFVAKDPGTYWYHSHQESFAQTGHGLYGMLIVDPAKPSVHDDVDVPLTLHTWDGVLATNMTTGTLRVRARPGQWVRLRLVDTDNTPHLMTIGGAPFLVAAMDGHDLNRPTPLTAVPVTIDGGQRYDLRFQMPKSGAVALFAANDENGPYHQTPAVLIGQDTTTPISVAVPTVGKQAFDFTAYGTPASDPITPQSHFDVTYTIDLGFMFGFSNGRPGPVFTLDGQSFPNTPTLMVKYGQLVRLRFVNNAIGGIHPMHLHGHTFTVLTKNGRPLAGSPVHLDTISVKPHETYEVAFYANNPGLWMLHCHNLFHANHGMDMMLSYPDISTPYTIGNASGNFPD
jgi:FtsP/CotA-like multicopper oxidase with cupredoxin domain